MQIWIVFGCSGDFEDFREAIIGVFDSEAKANSFGEEKRKLLDELGLHAYGEHHNCSNVENWNYYQSDEVIAKIGDIPMSYGGAWINVAGSWELQ